MKTLVIHPKDKTTDFLIPIYSGTDWTIIRDNISKGKIVNAIRSHDRIVMLGHGTEDGLLCFGRFIINSSTVYCLREKQCICIWCNADKFVCKYKLNGFYTGMIISEYEEAMMYGIYHNSSDINESNTLFTKAIMDSIGQQDMIIEAKKIYTSESNPIIIFNQQNLHSTCQQ